MARSIGQRPKALARLAKGFMAPARKLSARPRQGDCLGEVKP